MIFRLLLLFSSTEILMHNELIGFPVRVLSASLPDVCVRVVLLEQSKVL